MIIISGAAGFIGSAMAAKLLAEGYGDLVLADDFSRADKAPNYSDKPNTRLVHRDELPAFIEANQKMIQVVVHLGARTDTAEQRTEIFDTLNLHYSQRVWALCTQYQLPLIYASSAATYGGGEHGFSDDHALLGNLMPQNPYGRSKHAFDLWVLEEVAAGRAPFFWAGLKFFNVYGPNEYHKGRMASVIFHAYHQIRNSGYLKLFRSHNPDFGDGGQLRDFIYVKDLTAVILYLMGNRRHSGIYNLGTGQARAFEDLGKAVFSALGLPPAISYIDIPEDIRAAYQYYTQAEMQKLRTAGYTQPFTALESGVHEYVTDYLLPGRYL
jgi:ADP-L-glycero-D-manno-heptose 6-epimerase